MLLFYKDGVVYLFREGRVGGLPCCVFGFEGLAVFGGVLFLTELPQKVVAFFVIAFALVPLGHIFVTNGNGGEKLTLHIEVVIAPKQGVRRVGVPVDNLAHISLVLAKSSSLFGLLLYFLFRIRLRRRG